MQALHRSGGLLATWGVHANEEPLSRSVRSDGNPEATGVPVGSTGTAGGDTASPEKVMAVADRIRAFASILAANVDEHQTRVEAVNGAINASDLSGAPPEIIEAVDQLLAANETMRIRLEESQERLREQTKQLQSAEQRAETDALTGLANRGAFDKRFARQHAKGGAEAGVMAILDIDFFKRFNDEHGHRVGDEVLRGVAQMLETRLQPYGMVARFGGEEFCAMIDNVNYEEAIDLIEQTRIAVGTREFRFEGKRLKVTLSVGIGILRSQETSGEWLQRVDDALYRSKEFGRDCAHFIDGERFVRVGELVPSKDTATVAAIDRTPRVVSDPVVLNDADEVASQIKSTTEGLQSLTAEAVSVPVTAGEVVTAESIAVPSPISTFENEQSQLESIAATLQAMQPTERPKALAYLPDRETMIDGIVDCIAATTSGDPLMRLMAVTLSGQPSGVTMRSLLQLVRAAMRSQDRIGCLSHSTLLICLPDCHTEEAIHRSEQICSAAVSIGVNLASAEKSNHGERLSIGIVAIETATKDASSPPDYPAIDLAISQSQAVAMLASRLPSGDGKNTMPILERRCELALVASAISASRS